MLLFAPEGLGLILIGLWLYSIFDCISTDDSLVRNLPKGLWVMIVLFLPDIGSIAWLIMGRPMYAGWRPGDTNIRPAPRARGPEDSAGWSRHVPPMASERERLDAWEADLRRRERDLGQPPSDKPKGEDGDGKTDKDYPFTW